MKIEHNSRRLEQALKQFPISACFDTPGLEFILLTYEKKEILMTPHQPVPYLLFILKGDVKIYNLTAEGNFIPCILASEGSVLGNLEFFGNEASSFFCEADSQVLCLGLPIARYKTILANDTKFLHFLIQSLTHMVNIISAREQPSLTLSDKLVFYLKNETADHTFTGMDQMALKLGSSRRQLQRVVKELCEKEVLKRIARGTYSL